MLGGTGKGSRSDFQHSEGTTRGACRDPARTSLPRQLGTLARVDFTFAHCVHQVSPSVSTGPCLRITVGMYLAVSRGVRHARGGWHAVEPSRMAPATVASCLASP
jgi:hypothetical protein